MTKLILILFCLIAALIMAVQHIPGWGWFVAFAAFILLFIHEKIE